jgi:hypothetical protein
MRNSEVDPLVAVQGLLSPKGFIIPDQPGILFIVLQQSEKKRIQPNPIPSGMQWPPRRSGPLEKGLVRVTGYLTVTVTSCDLSESQLRSPEYSTVITLLPRGRTVGKVKIGLPPFPIVRNSAGPNG